MQKCISPRSGRICYGEDHAHPSFAHLRAYSLDDWRLFTNKEFEKYDKDCQRTIYITVDASNKLLAQADAGVTFLHRDEALYGKYEAYLDSCAQGYEAPLSMALFYKEKGVEYA